LLVELLADQVEAICGFKPELDSVAQFITDQVRPGGPVMPSRKRGEGTTASSSPSVATTSTAPDDSTGPGYILHGARVRTRSAIDTLIHFLRELVECDSSFLS
jgi:hypothetical protein